MALLSSSSKLFSTSFSFPLFLGAQRADSSTSSSVMLGLVFLQTSIVPDSLKKELVLDLKGIFDPIDKGVTEEVLGASKVKAAKPGNYFFLSNQIRLSCESCIEEANIVCPVEDVQEHISWVDLEPLESYWTWYTVDSNNISILEKKCIETRCIASLSASGSQRSKEWDIRVGKPILSSFVHSSFVDGTCPISVRLRCLTSSTLPLLAITECQITEVDLIGKNKYQLYELACSQKTKWPQDKKLDRRFGDAYFRDMLLDLKNYFTVVGPQSIANARRDCTTTGVAPGLDRDLPMNSKNVTILFTDGRLKGTSGRVYHIKVTLFKGHKACKPGEWRADANDLLFLGGPFRLLTPLHDEPTYWDDIVDGDIVRLDLVVVPENSLLKIKLEDFQSTADLLKLAANLKHLSSKAEDDHAANTITHEGRLSFLFLAVLHIFKPAWRSFPLEKAHEKAKQNMRKRSQVKEDTDKAVIDWLRSELPPRVSFRSFKASHHSNNLQNPEIVTHWNFAAEFCGMFYNQKCPVNDHVVTYNHIGKVLGYGETWLHEARKASLWIEKYGEDGEKESEEVVNELKREGSAKSDGHVKLFRFLKEYDMMQN
ncbi:hypothetical protein ARMGADRAFT_1033965 [Armillaria gallica]|uniref:Uncharacterized protein n=1 Tax=Armillaria gallica TaxID=47427 RepID=A0A2H3D043_ARMGA|nr:hypothetical protein ARMGADRAFT_1033965 [Armillaria gallica]